MTANSLEEGYRLSNEAAALNPDLINGLRVLSPATLSERLANKEVDPKVGIAIIELDDVDPIEVNGQVYKFFGASVAAGRHVTPHYHNHGIEPYYFVTGNGGEMNRGRVENGGVVWDPPKAVVSGDIEVVQEGQVHCLRNTGNQPLVFTFACPQEHILDNSPERPEGDRYLTADLPNGLPPWHPDAGPQT